MINWVFAIFAKIKLLGDSSPQLNPEVVGAGRTVCLSIPVREGGWVSMVLWDIYELCLLALKREAQISQTHLLQSPRIQCESRL